MQQGKIIDLNNQPTLSDSTAGNLDHDSITLPICLQVVDKSCLVSEDEIAAAMRLILEKEHLLVEGAVGVALASLLQHRNSIKNQNIIIIVCGANISLKHLQTLIN